MLLTMRALTAPRARSATRPRPRSTARIARTTTTARKAAHERASLLTPVAKAFSTDIGIEVASLGVQVHGGMGYIEETGAAQHYRDARIAPIYEGTNGIQAIDLVTRKLPLSGGAAVNAYLDELRATCGTVKAANDPAFGATGARLAEAVDSLDRATAWLLGAAGQSTGRGARRRDALSAAVRVMRPAAACSPTRRSRRAQLGGAECRRAASRSRGSSPRTSPCRRAGWRPPSPKARIHVRRRTAARGGLGAFNDRAGDRHRRRRVRTIRMNRPEKKNALTSRDVRRDGGGDRDRERGRRRSAAC